MLESKRLTGEEWALVWVVLKQAIALLPSEATTRKAEYEAIAVKADSYAVREREAGR